MGTMPLPLQLFWPLQALLGFLQKVLPLQTFTPAHLTMSPALPAWLVKGVAKNIAAALVASAIPVNRFALFMFTVTPENIFGLNCAPDVIGRLVQDGAPS